MLLAFYAQHEDRIYHFHNAKVLLTQFEIDRARKLAKDMLNGVCYFTFETLAEIPMELTEEQALEMKNNLS